MFSLNETKKIIEIIKSDINKFKQEVRTILPDCKILLAGSFAYGEGLIYAKHGTVKYISDLDFFIISSRFKTIRYMLKKPKKSFFKYNVPNAKTEIFFIWKPLLKLRTHLVTGRDIDTWKIETYGKINRNELLYNSLKKGFLALIDNNPKGGYVNAGLYCLRARMCAQFKNDEIFRLKSNLKWLNKTNLFKDREKNVLEKCLLYRLKNKNVKFSKKDFKIIKNALNQTFKQTKLKPGLAMQLHYIAYFLLKRKMPNIFINYPCLILKALYYKVNSDKNNLKLCLKKLNVKDLKELSRFNLIKKGLKF